MSITTKIVWSEGILLTQQHFQQWELHIQQRLQILQHHLAPACWGLASIDIDTDALVNNQLVINKCRAIFKHGLIVDYERTEEEALCCFLQVEPGETIPIYLGISVNQQIDGLIGYKQAQQQTAWEAFQHETHDLYDDKRVREVTFAKLKLTLLPGKTLEDQFYTMKIAEITSRSADVYVANQSFIPAILHIITSSMLYQQLGNLIASIQNKANNILAADQDSNNGRQLLLTQTLYATHAKLTHLREQPLSHPIDLYKALTEALCRLTVFTKTCAAPQYPQYRHEQLTDCFAELFCKLRKTLAGISTKQITIMILNNRDKMFYLCKHIEKKHLKDHELFIVIQSPTKDPKIVERFIGQAKISSRSIIEELVTSALPGVKIEHTRRKEISHILKQEGECFYIKKSGALWQQIVDEQNLAVFLPPDFDNISLRLIAIED